MSRIARIDVEGIPYHVTQRGNARQQLFFDDEDYSLYLHLVNKNCRRAGLRVWAYCLMPNHVHLIVLPERTRAMAQMMSLTSADFARHYNLKKRTCGHVWQARYFSTPLEGAHLWQALAYVERNPVRAHLSPRAEDYPWSSARLRLASYPSAGMLDLTAWQREYDWPRWKRVLETTIDEEAFGRRLQDASRRGRPLGSEEFLTDLEKHCARELRPRPVGRPKKLR